MTRPDWRIDGVPASDRKLALLAALVLPMLGVPLLFVFGGPALTVDAPAWSMRIVDIAPRPAKEPVVVPQQMPHARPRDARKRMQKVPAPTTSIVDLVSADTPAIAPDATDQPLSTGDLLDRARQTIHAQGEPLDFRPDPLGPRRNAMTARNRMGLRMREPMSTKRVLEGIGQLFGGGPADPCPNIRNNIQRIGLQGDSALLQEELRRLRQMCE